MFVLSKLFWFVAQPGDLLVLILVAGTIWLLVSGHRRGLGLVVLAAIGFTATAALPVGEWMIMPLEDRIAPPATLPPNITGIILLGGGVNEVISAARNHPTVNDAADRLVGTAALARRYPEARIVVSGGSSRIIPNGAVEAVAMENFLVEEGIDRARITREARSRNTYENALYSYDEVKPKPGETWLLVTSAWHMPRAVGCFREVGWHVIPYPVDYKTTGHFSLVGEEQLGSQLALVSLAAKEWIGLLIYRVMGRTDALFPSA
ncbi:MAG TPA: YdcF family protein [Stellaceae bacterium]|nr:YdcF family protein [Stellaceae bacterium]